MAFLNVNIFRMLPLKEKKEKKGMKSDRKKESGWDGKSEKKKGETLRYLLLTALTIFILI